LYLPSIIHAVADQTALVNRHGLEVETVGNVAASDLPPPISPKLNAPNGKQFHAVTGYLLRKR
jgi:hypothetical protein